MSRGGTRMLRFAIIAVLLLVLVYHLSTRNGLPSYVPGRTSQPEQPQPPLEVIGQDSTPAKTLSIPAAEEEDKEIVKQEPMSGDYTPVKETPYHKANATFVSLARNEDLWELVMSIRQVEDRFNGKYHYDWVFLNDKPFNEEFKRSRPA